MTKRLCEIFSELERAVYTADIGCDHGYLSLKILQNNLSQRVLATDISQKCLNKTIQLLSENDLGNKADFVCVNGLPSDKTPDQILIAGMGGLEITKILQTYFVQNQNRPILVLQPMRDEVILREFLNKNGYKIVADRIFIDKKFYRIIKAKIGTQNLSEKQLYFGAVESQYQTIEFQSWLKNYTEKLQKIIKNLSQDDEKTKKINYILNLCSELKESVKC